MNRSVFHIDVDAFFAQVEQLLNHSLKGKPVIVGHISHRGVVASASYEARRYGIRSAMPITQAKQLCPQAIFCKVNFSIYEEFSQKIHTLLDQFTPLIEMASLDEAYLDMTSIGSSQITDPTKNQKKLVKRTSASENFHIATIIKQRLKEETSLNVSIGIGSNKLIAKIASAQAKPNGIIEVPSGKEKVFLASLSLEKLPGVGKKTYEILQKLGLKTIGNLAQFPKRALQMTLGIAGESLLQSAHGIDDSPVAPESEAKSISRETTFDKDTQDRSFLEGVLYSLVEKVGQQLREKHLQAGVVEVKLRYADFKNTSASQKLTESTNWDKPIYQIARELIRRILSTSNKKVRLIGVATSAFRNDIPIQADLFGDLTNQNLSKLYQTIDKIRDKYGFDALTTGHSIKSRPSPKE